MLFTAEEHPHNAPETWEVVKKGERLWHLQTKDGVTLESTKTKRQAEYYRESGFFVNLYEKERKLYES